MCTIETAWLANHASISICSICLVSTSIWLLKEICLMTDSVAFLFNGLHAGERNSQQGWRKLKPTFTLQWPRIHCQHVYISPCLYLSGCFSEMGEYMRPSQPASYTLVLWQGLVATVWTHRSSHSNRARVSKVIPSSSITLQITSSSSAIQYITKCINCLA